MSIRAIDWAYQQEVNPAARKFVLVTIAQFADGRGKCRYSQDEIAALTGQSKRSVQTHLADLEADGLIERVEHHREDGSRDIDEIRLVLRAPASRDGSGGGEEVAPPPGEKVSPHPGEKVAPDTSTGGEKVAPQGKTNSLDCSSTSPTTNNNRAREFQTHLGALREAGLLGVWADWVRHTQAAQTTQEAQAPQWAAWLQAGKGEQLRLQVVEVIALGASVAHPWGFLQKRMTATTTPGVTTSPGTQAGSAAGPVFRAGMKVKLLNGDIATITAVRSGGVSLDHPMITRVPIGQLRELEVIHDR